jgi:pimeloyl-ACP methyl ester carboxylesterase
MPPRLFRAPFEGHDLVGDVLSSAAAPLRLLVLHGAGQSHRARFQLTREHLLAHGIGSAAFDCIGHGDTGGDLKSSSLANRTAQACAAIEAVPLSRPFSVFGASMGAYTAASLLPRYPIDALVLLGPAMYAAEAHAIPFNAGFTDIIRRPQSWVSSEAWSWLAAFTGRLLIIAGEHDTVIPPDVIRRVYAAAEHTSDRKLVIAPGASHMILTDLRAHAPDQLDHVLNLMSDTLNGSPPTPPAR